MIRNSILLLLSLYQITSVRVMKIIFFIRLSTMGYKFLWLIGPSLGHINTTLGICKELVNQGHTVIYYTSPEYAEHVHYNTGADVRVIIL